MELICNHYSKIVKKPIAEFIGGPKTLTIHWHPVYKKIIYIYLENGMPILWIVRLLRKTEDYLYDLILSTDVF